MRKQFGGTNMEPKYGRNSFFDGGLLSYVGWALLGGIVTFLPSVFATPGHFAWYIGGELIILWLMAIVCSLLVQLLACLATGSNGYYFPLLR